MSSRSSQISARLDRELSRNAHPQDKETEYCCTESTFAAFAQVITIAIAVFGIIALLSLGQADGASPTSFFFKMKNITIKIANFFNTSPLNFVTFTILIGEGGSICCQIWRSVITCAENDI